MTTAADAIANSVRKLQPGTAFTRALVLEVRGLGEDDQSIIGWDGSAEDVYPCSTGYRYRAVGDVVLAVQLAGGSSVVLCGLGAADEEKPLTRAEIVELVLATVPYTRVDWGTSAPGAGYVQASSVWLKETGGDPYIYGQLPAPATPATAKPNPPAPVTLAPDSEGSWRIRGGSDVDVQVGTKGGPDWYGGWFFGTRIAAACAGKTVTKMEFTASRTPGDVGRNRAVPVYLGLHNETGKRRPSIGYTWRAGSLSKGGKDTFVLPADRRARLASGASRGIGVEGHEYLKFTRDRARLRITFA